MAFKVPGIPVCVAVACCGVALIFQIVAVGGNGWLVSGSTEVGLFRTCVSDVCVKIPGNLFPDWWKAVQAFSILGLLSIAGSLVLGIPHFWKENTNALSLIAIVLCSVSVIFLVIELAVFGAKTSVGAPTTLGTPEFGYGFILSIIACILSAIAAVLFGVGRNSLSA